MITIKNKKDSIIKMKELKLNYFPLDYFSTEDINGIRAFFEKYTAKEYVLRTINKAKGQYFYVYSFQEAVEKLKNFDKELTISVSYNPYKENIVLVGDIKVHKGYDGETVDLTARTDQDATHRNIYENPQYNLHASLEDDKVWRIPGFSKIMRYIIDHELYDVIVEFAVYNCKLGINNENVVVTELRTGY